MLDTQKLSNSCQHDATGMQRNRHPQGRAEPLRPSRGPGVFPSFENTQLYGDKLKEERCWALCLETCRRS